MRKSIFSLSLLLMSSLAWSESPVGQWQTVNDETGEAEAVIQIVQQQGELQGKIVELIDPEEPDPVCELCEGEKKDQPVVGMTILWGLSETDDGWEDGYILDPNNGQTYNSRLTVNQEGDLEVRGFVGFALLGRTQIWYRVE